MSLEIVDRHSEALFEFLWCPVCGHEVFRHIPFEGVICKNGNTQVELQESRETCGYEEAVIACFNTATTWNRHVDEKLRRDLPEGSARVKILGAPGAYEVDWWSSEPNDEWQPVERGEFDDVVGQKSADGAKVQRWFECQECGYESRSAIVYGSER